jgi:hypothetical protein
MDVGMAWLNELAKIFLLKSTRRVHSIHMRSLSKVSLTKKEATN